MEGESKEPTFFKIIKTGFNTDDLRISPKFRRHMLNELSETATLELKGSSKCSWTVLVSQIEGDIYIKNGWQKFIKDNPLGDFGFLVFRYERPMHFTIEIFDKTACMRNNLLEKSTRADKTKRPRGRPRKCNRSAAGENIPSCQVTELKEIKEEEAATLLSSGFRSFTSTMEKSSYNVAVPVDFSREHLPEGYYHIVLKNSKGQKWKVKAVCSCTTLKLSGGWLEFRRANQINWGDICSWNIRVHQTGSSIYLKEGWREFLEDHSIGDSEFLVVRYDGCMQLSIQIFDKNHVERVDFPDTETHDENHNFANNSGLNGGEEDYKCYRAQENAKQFKPKFPTLAIYTIGNDFYYVNQSQELKIGAFAALTSIASSSEVATVNDSSLVGKDQFYSYLGSYHGTTIVWIRLATELLVGVDSFTIVNMIPDDPKNLRNFEVLVSETDEKFVAITDGVFATLAGDRTRGLAMVEYVQQEMNKVRAAGEIEPDFDIICMAAIAYFRFFPRDPKFHHISTIHICGWIPNENRHRIVEVGDLHENTGVLLEKAYFGTGSGFSWQSLLKLQEMEKQYDTMEAPVGVGVVKDCLINGAVTDPHTGGVLKVYSVKERTCEVKYEGCMMDELNNDRKYENIFFDGKTMLVIFERTHWAILTPQDLKEYLKRFDEVPVKIHMLGWANNFLLYRVVLSSKQCRDNWFNSCEKFKAPVRRQTFSITEGSCECYLGYATKSLLGRARTMHSFDDLASPIRSRRNY